MSHDEHRSAARSEEIGCAVVTISDTRTEEDDQSGRIIRDCLREAEAEVVRYHVVPDEPDVIGGLLDELVADPDIDAILCNGGTGISARDRTYEAIKRRLDKTLPGFGELFRQLSYEEIGSAAMLSRAAAGVSSGVLIFSMPGSANAVTLAMEALILPELRHLVWELRRHE